MAVIGKNEFRILALVGLIAVVLLVADRKIRIGYLLGENFQNAMSNPQRCGLDLDPCPFPTRCANGFCIVTEPPVIRERNPIPVLP